MVVNIPNGDLEHRSASDLCKDLEPPFLLPPLVTKTKAVIPS